MNSRHLGWVFSPPDLSKQDNFSALFQMIGNRLIFFNSTCFSNTIHEYKHARYVRYIQRYSLKVDNLLNNYPLYYQAATYAMMFYQHHHHNTIIYTLQSDDIWLKTHHRQKSWHMQVGLETISYRIKFQSHSTHWCENIIRCT